MLPPSAPPPAALPDFLPLLEAFNDGSNNTFRVDLPPGTTYTATVTMGDTRATHGPVDIYTVVNGVATRVTSITLGDGRVVSSIYSPLGQFLTGSFQVTAPAGSGLQPVELEFKPESGAVDFVLNALDIVQAPALIALSATPGVNAQGLAVFTVSGSGAKPNSLVTVSTSQGSVVSADADPNYAGTQVATDNTGHFSFVVTSATGGPATLSAREVTGASAGTAAILYPAQRYFDFNSGTSPTETGPTGISYTAVQPGDVYSAAQGYGWLTPVNGFDRPVAQGYPALTGPFADLLEAGNTAASATFQVDVPGNQTYQVTVTAGDLAGPHTTNIQANGGGAPVSAPVLSTATGQFLTERFEVFVGANGHLQIALQGGGNSTFAINGLNVQPVPALQLQLTPSSPSIPADGVSSTAVNGIATDSQGDFLPAGSEITVATTAGVITTPDADPNLAGTQVVVGANGYFTFTLQAGTTAGTATITASEVTGAALASAPAAIDLVTSPGTAYAAVAGTPPPITSAAWQTWFNNLLDARIAACPLQRTTTYYFSQSGNDITGDGSEAHPFKTVAKAQAIEDAAPEDMDISFLFMRGDVWREPIPFDFTKSNWTIADYGPADLPPPLFSNFSIQYDDAGWQYVGGNLWKRAETADIGWIRDAADPLGTVYVRESSSAMVGNNTSSWWWDQSGTDPNSGGVPTLYLNLGAVNPNLLPLEAAPADNELWPNFDDCNDSRLQNVRFDGWGLTDQQQAYGLHIVNINGEQMLVEGVQVYYTGYHAIGHLGQDVRGFGIATFIDCQAGYCMAYGVPSVYVSYSDAGGDETIWDDCEATYGALPTAAWYPASTKLGESFFNHSNGTTALVIAYDCSVAANPFGGARDVRGKHAGGRFSRSGTLLYRRRDHCGRPTVRRHRHLPARPGEDELLLPGPAIQRRQPVSGAQHTNGRLDLQFHVPDRCQPADVFRLCLVEYQREHRG